MLDFQLFRVKILIPPQVDMFTSIPTSEDVLVAAVSERPTAEIRKGYEWHIGNVEEVASNMLYFAFGRVTKSTIQLYDEAKGDFVDVEFESAPYTHVLLETALGVAAIARNSKLAPTPAGTGRQLAKLLERSQAVEQVNAAVEVLPIQDPEEFIELLKTAYSITRFSMTFGRPNPFDVNQDFHEPMERLLREADGREGRTTLKGKDLDVEVLEPLARSAAATGNDASATMKRTKRARPVRRSLKNNPAVVTHEEPTTLEEKRDLAGKLREAYQRVRRRSAD